MTQYVIAQIVITDREAYGRYQAGFMPILVQYGGRLLAAEEAPRVVEGDWAFQKVILLAFEDDEAVRKWSESAEYKRISEDRTLGTHGVGISVRGL
ncbi:MAG: hypothetical protein JWR84_824 [Caulobacter sp.]|nr:hypothetical protein [Caulobacter sp.]